MAAEPRDSDNWILAQMSYLFIFYLPAKAGLASFNSKDSAKRKNNNNNNNNNKHNKNNRGYSPSAETPKNDGNLAFFRAAGSVLRLLLAK